jgi:sugar/nucleoside kinase (ribokinase family)
MVEPVDTTGAGDCFVGVFLASWLNAVAPRDALRLAVAAASRSVTVAGAQELRLDGATLLGGSAVPAPDPFAVSQQG